MDSRTHEKYSQRFTSEASGILDTAEIARGKLTLEWASSMGGRVYFVRIVRPNGEIVGSAPMIDLDIPAQIFAQQVHFQ